MKPRESARGTVSPFRWKTYSVRRADKEPLLRFILEALEMRGCRVLHASDANRAPFYIVFETPAGERHGLLAYAFFANANITRNRPEDEHRFQIKYGGQLKGVLEVATDPHALVTTIFLGIDPQRRIFIAADPLMHNPSPMSRSIEFKSQNVEDALGKGWAAWERERLPPKTKTRPTPQLDEDTRIEVLIGGRKERLFDLIQLERIARGLDPGERHLVADKLVLRPKPEKIRDASHKLLKELNVPPEALFDLIDGASRLKMAVRGWIAEAHLETALKGIPGVTDCRRLNAEGQPDLTLRWKDGPPILVECKNVLRKRDSAGRPRLDFQRTRASKADPCSRYYRPSDFAVLAACLHAVTEEWRFSFALTRELSPHPRCFGRIASNILVSEPAFSSRPDIVFDKCS